MKRHSGTGVSARSKGVEMHTSGALESWGRLAFGRAREINWQRGGVALPRPRPGAPPRAQPSSHSYAEPMLFASILSPWAVWALLLGLALPVAVALSTILAGAAAAGSLARAGASIFGDDEEDPSRGKRLARLFESRLQEARQKSPTESARFKAGRGALSDLLSKQRQRDEAAAAARGLGGSQFEVAQGAKRAETLGKQTRRLVGEAESSLQRRRQNLRSALLRSEGLAADIAGRRKRREAREQRQLSQLLSGAFQSAALASSGGGAGGGASGG